VTSFYLFDDMVLVLALTGLTHTLLSFIHTQSIVHPYSRFSSAMNAFTCPAADDSIVALVGWRPWVLIGMGLIMLALVALQLIWSALLILPYGLLVMQRLRQCYEQPLHHAAAKPCR